MYANDFEDKLPDRDYIDGPYLNPNKKQCGGEWQHTPAIQLDPYLRNPLIWVCPTKKRGLNYRTEQGSFDPSYTGFLSYGFNYLAVFGLDYTQPTPLPRKQSGIERPPDTLAVTEIGGNSNPGDSGGMGSAQGDAAWLDDWWQLNSYPNNLSPARTGPSDTNPRFQTQYGKHNLRVNSVYVDGHSDPVRPSKIVWGQFHARYSGNANSSLGGKVVSWDSPVSTSELDAAQVYGNTP
jgi:prepilin-type processing-associated H-X9-DG protein